MTKSTKPVKILPLKNFNRYLTTIPPHFLLLAEGTEGMALDLHTYTKDKNAVITQYDLTC